MAGVEDVEKADEHTGLGGISKNDFPKLENVLGEDLFYPNSTGVADTKASYIASLKSGKRRYSAGKINDLRPEGADLWQHGGNRRRRES